MNEQYFIILLELIFIYILYTLNNNNNNNINNNINNNNNINSNTNIVPMNNKISHGKLNNGLKYIINNTKCGDKITVMLYVKVGSRDEPLKLNGMSHVLEHMMFQGTDKYPSSQKLHEAIDKYGAIFNAYTSLDITCYYITIYTEYIDYALSILSDLYFNSLILDKHLQKEKTVVINEIKKNNSNPKSVIQQDIVSNIMKTTPMSRNIAGTEKNVKSFKREDLMSFLNFYYNPNKVLLSIGGYIGNQSKLIKNIHNLFGINKTYPSTKKLKHTRELFHNFHKIKTHSQINNLKKKLDTNYITIGFPAYKLNSKNSYVLDLLSTILAGYMSSRLYLKLRNEMAIIYNINNNIDALEDCGYYYLMCGTHDVEKCVGAIMDELNKIKDELVLEDEINRAKDYINGQQKMSRNDSNFLATHYGINYLYFGKIITIEESLKHINNVTPKDIQRVAKLTFKKSKMKLHYMGSKSYNLKNTLTD